MEIKNISDLLWATHDGDRRKFTEHKLIKLTESKLLQRLHGIFPKYRQDIEEVVNDHCVFLLAFAIAFMQKNTIPRDRPDSLTNHWLRLNYRYVRFDLIDKLKKDRRHQHQSLDVPFGDSDFTLGDRLADENDYEQLLIFWTLQDRLKAAIDDPRMTVSIYNEDPNVTSAAIIQKIIAKEKVKQIASELNFPQGNYSTLLSRKVYPLLRVILDDFAA